ncbi:MAG: TonB-dependent receptor, partial [Pseudomonadota bacterium]
TIYGMADIDHEFSGVPVRGNVGFQWVDTTQKSTGTLNFFGNQTLQTVEESYDDFLPSLNLSAEIQDNTFLRFAAAKTVTRPRLDQLAANQGLDTNNNVCIDTDGDELPDQIIAPITPANTCFTVSGGNPFLRPYESISLDLAFEKYFGDASAVSIAVFNKDLSNWVLDLNEVVDASQSIEQAGLGDLIAGVENGGLTRLSGPVNFADGSIFGIEATVNLSFDDIFPDGPEGFGVYASYTYADSNLDDDEGNSLDIPGYSENVWSANVYYENFGWRGRLSARHRGEFLSEVPLFDGSLSGATAQEETVLDAQIGYDWDDGPLEGFGVNLEVFNITDEPFVTEAQTTDPSVVYPSRHELYGTTYNFTVTKKF